MGSYELRMGVLEDSCGFLWVPMGCLCPPLLVCPVVRCHYCPVLVSLIDYRHISWELIGFLRAPLGFLLG